MSWNASIMIISLPGKSRKSWMCIHTYIAPSEFSWPWCWPFIFLRVYCGVLRWVCRYNFMQVTRELHWIQLDLVCIYFPSHLILMRNIPLVNCIDLHLCIVAVLTTRAVAWETTFRQWEQSPGPDHSDLMDFLHDKGLTGDVRTINMSSTLHTTTAFTRFKNNMHCSHWLEPRATFDTFMIHLIQLHVFTMVWPLMNQLEVNLYLIFLDVNNYYYM